MNQLFFITIFAYVLIKIDCNDLKGFDDSVLFKINWPGNDADILQQTAELESLMVTTHNKEKYQCMMPSVEPQESELPTDYTGPGPFDLITKMFSTVSCSYRIESYWTYEICHGYYIKQYHEDREGKTTKKQEYYLGKWDKQKTEDMRAELAISESKTSDKLKYKKIDGVNLPYFDIEMTDGTYCNLNNEHRSTRVFYVCYPHGKNEVYSLKETSTCNYEVIILTASLCAHPNFKQQETSDNTINCIPVGNAPVKPRSLLMMEMENMKKLLDASKGFQRRVTIVKVDKQDGTLKAEVLNDDLLPAINKAVASALSEASSEETPPSLSSLKTPILTSKLDDTSPVKAFLEGKHCLTGGTGWWKYEFCYGRYVRQFHVDKSGESSIMLGYFDEKLHKQWLNDNPQKRPKGLSARTHLTHFYQGGSICDKTGDKRQTEVKLKCLENSPTATKVSLYLMEPQTCQYILGVESPLICEILDKADEHGLVPNLILHGGESPANSNDITDDETSEKKSDGKGVKIGDAVVEDFEIHFGND